MLAESLKIQVNTILDIAKSQSGDLKVINSRIPLNEIVEESKILGESLLLKKGKQEFVCETSWNVREAPTFIGDRERVMQVVRNLLGNAFKFSLADKHNQIQLSFKLDHQTLFIEVSDQGIGIPDEDLQTIFRFHLNQPHRLNSKNISDSTTRSR